MKDIFGNEHNTIINSKTDVKSNKNSTNKNFSSKNFLKISLDLDTTQMQSDYVLIHRIIQKRLINSLVSNPHNLNLASFLKIFSNELKIKSGKLDIVNATRDSLLEYCLNNS